MVSIHAYQTELKDTNGNNWKSLASQCMKVVYEWWNCIDNAWFTSGYASFYTFETIFR